MRLGFSSEYNFTPLEPLYSSAATIFLRTSRSSEALQKWA
jgi:hypothetical protein